MTEAGKANTNTRHIVVASTLPHGEFVCWKRIRTGDRSKKTRAGDLGEVGSLLIVIATCTSNL